MQSGDRTPRAIGLAEALRGQLLGDQRRSEQLVLQPVPARLGDLRRRRAGQRHRGTGCRGPAGSPRSSSEGGEVDAVGVATATE